MKNIQKAEKAGIKYLRNPGVNLLRQGEKVTLGKNTGQPCLVFGVTEKRDVPQKEKIPSEIAGIKTDVIEVPPFRAHSDPTIKYRPVVGGVSGCVGVSHVATLGGVVWDSLNGKLVGLTNNHAAGLRYDPAYATPTGGNEFTTGLDFLQPSYGDGGSAETDVLGQVLRAHANYFGIESEPPPNLIDAAIVSIDGIGQAWYNILNLHAGPFPFANKAAWSVGATVAKSGRTTGMTTGTVTSKSASVMVEYGEGDNNKAIFTDQILIEGTGFGSPGDSGSLLTAIVSGTIKIVGLYFAGGGGSIGIANHIQTVASLLNVASWDGSVILPKSLAPESVVNGTHFLRQSDTELAVTHEAD